MNYQKILVAIDFSASSNVALQRAAALAKASDAELNVVHAIPAYTYRGSAYQEPLSPDAEENDRAEAESALSKAVSALGQEHAPARVEVLKGDPRIAITDYARKADIDLIVVASTGHGRLHEILLGSVTDHVSHVATCSVLVVKG